MREKEQDHNAVCNMEHVTNMLSKIYLKKKLQLKQTEYTDSLKDRNHGILNIKYFPPLFSFEETTNESFEPGRLSKRS